MGHLIHGTFWFSHNRLKAEQLFQFRHSQPSGFQLLLSCKYRGRFGLGGRLGHVASSDPLQIGLVVGVGGVGWDKGVVREAEDGVALGELVHGHGLQLSRGGVMDGVSTVYRTHRAVTTKQPEPSRTYTGDPSIAYV